jgi:hypothetical protein
LRARQDGRLDPHGRGRYAAIGSRIDFYHND